MKKRLLTAVVGVLAIAASTLSTAAPLLTDSFESGSLSATNTAGFRWEATNKTSIVNTTASKDGSYALSFLYPAGNYMSEQRFSLGGSYKDIWFKFWLKVPTNFSHGSMNNKLFALWMDGYSSQGAGPTVVWESWGDGQGGSKLAVHWSEGNYSTAGVHSQSKPFISVPSDRGRWMQIVIHVKAATNRVTPINPSSNPYNSGDGVIQLYRRWDGESSFTKFHEVLNANIASVPSTGKDGFHTGYLMGWANSAYSTDTQWLVDQFTTSQESLLTTGSTTTSSPPSAPSSLRLQ